MFESEIPPISETRSPENTPFWTKDFSLACLSNLGSMSRAAAEFFENNPLPVNIVGKENLPKKGGYVLLANHHIRAKDLKNMTGPDKMTDIGRTVGAAVSLAQEALDDPQHNSVIVTPSKVARPEQFDPNTPMRDRLLGWASNKTRALYLYLNKLASASDQKVRDVLPVPHHLQEMPGFFKAARRYLQDGHVIVMFPEGEVSSELRPAHAGIGLLSKISGAEVVPMSVWTEENGTLQVNIGEPEPPAQDRDFQRYTDKIMRRLASTLPPELRGVYALTPDPGST